MNQFLVHDFFYFEAFSLQKLRLMYGVMFENGD
jgi:hypothetical protein